MSEEKKPVPQIKKPVLKIRIRRVSERGGCEAEVIGVPQEVQVVFEGVPADKDAKIHYLGQSRSFGERFDVAATNDGDTGVIEVEWRNGRHGVPSPRFPPGT